MRKIIGVGPHPQPWPEGEHYDKQLLEGGDSRNVIDRYRYWTIDAIGRDMAAQAGGLHVAIENWQHDFNIGSIVRSANAMGARAVHIIGKRHWNRRGAMATEKYIELYHHVSIEAFLDVARRRQLAVIAVDNVDGARPLSSVTFPQKAVLVFGGEGPGISSQLLAASDDIVAIEQFGSTRSLNVGVAAGIVLYAWAQQHVVRHCT